MSEKRLRPLARLLHVDPKRLKALDALTEKDLDKLTDQVSERLYAEDHERLSPILAILDRIPAKIAAKIARDRLSPPVLAVIAVHLEPKKASDVIPQLPTALLAEVARSLEFRRAGPILAAIGPRQIAAVAQHLADDGHWKTMAAVAEQLPDASLEAATDALSDEAVLAIAAESTQRTVRRTLDLGDPARAARLRDTPEVRSALAA